MALTKKELEDMEKERTEENDAFKQAKSDDENAIALIEKAIEALSGYYKDNKIEMGPIQGSVKLLQEPEFDKGDQAPEAEFKKKGHRKNESKGIISIMTMIKEDLEDEIKNGIKNEIAAQEAYEKQVAAANTMLDNLKKNGEKKDAITEDCDWMIENFEERKKKREVEQQGLVKAKEFLAGASPAGGFLQH